MRSTRAGSPKAKGPGASGVGGRGWPGNDARQRGRPFVLARPPEAGEHEARAWRGLGVEVLEGRDRVGEEHYPVARHQQVGPHGGLSAPDGRIGYRKGKMGPPRPALARHAEEFRGDVDAKHLGFRMGGGEAARNLPRTAADIERGSEWTCLRYLEQPIGQRREAAVGAAPFVRPSGADAAGPFAAGGHLPTIRNRVRRARGRAATPDGHGSLRRRRSAWGPWHRSPA